jgi:hypothetical protein
VKTLAAMNTNIEYFSWMFNLKFNPYYKGIFRLRWHQYNKKNELFFSFYLLRKTYWTALQQVLKCSPPSRLQAFTISVCFMRLCEMFLSQCWQRSVQYCISAPPSLVVCSNGDCGGQGPRVTTSRRSPKNFCSKASNWSVRTGPLPHRVDHQRNKFGQNIVIIPMSRNFVTSRCYR